MPGKRDRGIKGWFLMMNTLVGKKTKMFESVGIK